VATRETLLAEFHRYRPLLFSIAYRMLGAVADAEDMVQETFIRWQQASGEEVRSPKAFLVTIISRLCINHLESARVRREEYVGEWLPEPVATDPANDPLEILRADESLSIAFLTVLERLNPVERAVFLLHEVFEYEYAEIAAALERSEANCRQILKRAREHIHEARPRLKVQNREHDELLGKFLQATRSGDLEGLMSLLSTDVVLHTDGGGKGPALPNRLKGADKVARAALGGFHSLPKRPSGYVVQINGENGLVSYIDGRPFGVITLDTGDGRIRAIYMVSNPDKLTHLPSPPRLPS
jgi:RNA polymerase sigma-70 factor, ECF subfamily